MLEHLAGKIGRALITYAERHNHKDAEILHEAELVIETYKIVKDW